MQAIHVGELLEEIQHVLRSAHPFAPMDTPNQEICGVCGVPEINHAVVTPKPMWDDPGLEEVVRMAEGAHDPVNSPSHYTAYKGLEIIDLTEQLNFNRGNAVKYIARAGLKDPNSEAEDLKKARWYIDREIQRIQQSAQVS